MARTRTHRRRRTWRAGRLLLLVSVALVGMAVLAPAANAAASLTVNKTSTPAEGGTAKAGSTISYSVVVSNAGPDTTTGLKLTDDTPPNTAYVAGTAKVNGIVVPDGPSSSNPFASPGFSFASQLATGDSHTVTFDVKVNPTAVNGAGITNTATATATNASPASNGAAHTVSAPVLAATKTADPAADAEVKPGDTITYTVVVENKTTAGDSATNVKFTDATPANTEYVAESATVDGTVVAGPTNPFETEYSLAATLAPGAKKTVTFKVKVKSAVPDGTVITNTAKAKADNHAEITGEVKHKVKAAGAAVTLKVTASAVPEPGTKVAAGAQITYTAQVSNDATAAEPAKTVVYKDPTPEGTTYVDGSSTRDGTPVPDASNPFTTGYALGDIAPGASTTLSYKVTVNSGAGAIARTVTVTAANAPAEVTATTAHTGPGAEAPQPRRGSRGGSGGGGTGGSGAAGSSVGGAGTGSDEAGLAFTGLDTTAFALLALSLFLVGLTLIARGRVVERYGVTLWDEARVKASRLMTRDPSVGPWFFSARRR